MRRRAWYVGVAALGLLFLVALVAIVAAESYGRMRLNSVKSELEAVVGSLDPEAHAPAPVAEELNAVPWLQAGSAAVRVEGEEDLEVLKRLSRSPLADWSPQDLDRARIVVDRNSDALQLLARAAPLKAFSFDLDYAAGVEMELPNFIDLLRAVKLLSLDARLALAEGDTDRALRATALQHQIARAIGGEAPLVSRLIAVACDKFFLQYVHEILTSPASTLESVVSLSRMLERGALPRRPHFLAGEIAVMADSFTEDRLKTLDAEIKPGIIQRRLLAFFAADILEGYRGLVACNELPYRQTLTCIETLEYGLVGRPIARMLIPNMIDAGFKIRSAEAAMRLARTALWVRQEGLERGSYPIDLRARPEAQDPVQVTGETFAYRLEDDGSAVLSLPELAELWDETYAETIALIWPAPFSYRLPPLETSAEGPV